MVASVIIGVNSILWGYGISWLVSRVRSVAADARGFEVAAPDRPNPQGEATGDEDS